MWFTVFLLTVLGYVYYRFLQTFSYWSQKGVTSVGPKSYLEHFAILGKKAPAEVFRDIYLNSPNERYIGWYPFGKPVLILKDPNLIKKIAVKEFESFTDHRPFIRKDTDPLWGKNLFATNGDRWRTLRPLLSPAFTSSKMRAMFVLIEECANQFGDFFSKEKGDIVELEMKDVFTKYTNDVIATTAFGLKCNSLKDPTNDFYQNGKKATNFGATSAFRYLVHIIFPYIGRFLGIRLFPRNVTEYFTSLIEETMKIRTEKHIIRLDMIHLLMEAKKGQLKDEEDVTECEGFSSTHESNFEKTVKEGNINITTEEVVAQAFVFFLAGFDTVSTVITFAAYELAVNPEIQEKLRDEIDVTWKCCNGKITYEALLKMEYIDMVISETLRKWPPFPITDRKCNKSFIIEPELLTEKAFNVEAGTVCWIPIFGLHRDPKYYENPETFDPERFSEENKHKIQLSTYVPFGIGPRNCIGSRFGLIEIKLLIFHILSRFEIVRTEKSQIPIVLSKRHFIISGEGGVHLGFKKRVSYDR